MGKANTTTEAMEHIASVVNEITTNIATESEKLVKSINSIEEKTNKAINDSERTINSWENDIRNLEAQIAAYQSQEDEDHSYQSQIDACQQQIIAIRAKIRKERMRNNELRQTLSQFRQQSSQTLKTIKQTNLATENANTNGKQYLFKKTNIIAQGYNKIVTGATALGAGLGLASAGGGNSSGSSSSGFPVKGFGANKSAAQAWGNANFQNWNDSLSIVERQAIIDYKKELYPHESSYYVNINNTLRGKDSFRDGNQMRYMRMHNALSRSSVPEDVVAYRSITQDAYNNMMNNALTAGSDGLRDNGFMSCSLSCDSVFSNSSANDVIMQMTITEGSRGAYIGNVGPDFESECEILLDCGSTLFVTNTSQVPRGSITGNPHDTEMITLVEGVVEA